MAPGRSVRAILLWGVLIAGAFAVAAVVTIETGTRLNALAFATRPEFENWADPAQGTVMPRLLTGLAAALVVAVGVTTRRARATRRT